MKRTFHFISLVAGPVSNYQVTDTVTVCVAEMDFVIGMQYPSGVCIFSLHDFCAQILCSHMHPHFLLAREQIADPTFVGRE